MAEGNFKFEFDEEDIKYLQGILAGFGEIDGSKAIMASLSKGIAKIIRKGKSNLAASNGEKRGNLKKSFRKKQVRKWVSAYGGFRRGKGGGNHAHLIDRGTDERFTKEPYTDKLGRTYPKGMKRGSISKNNPNHGTKFWTRAVEGTGPSAMEHTMNVIEKELVKIINKKK